MSSDLGLIASDAPDDTKAIIKESFKTWNSKIDSMLNKDALSPSSDQQNMKSIQKSKWFITLIKLDITSV